MPPASRLPPPPPRPAPTPAPPGVLPPPWEPYVGRPAPHEPTRGRAPDSGNGLAVAGFVLALIGVLVGWVPFGFFVAWVLGVLGIVFGAIGIVRTRDARPRRHRGLAIAAVCLGIGALGTGVIGAVLTNRIVDHIDQRLFTNDPADSELHQDECAVATNPDRASASQAYASGTITNRRADYESFRVRVEFIAPSGRRIGTAFDHVLSIPPGETRRWQATDIVTGTYATLTCIVSTS